mmetsp:Transcript_20124/g.27962  ORF Transcript_20124/g.27962 Transcript_20124/m.27962 type:complete len:142 (+) Transcript_20124:85-510(+)
MGGLVSRSPIQEFENVMDEFDEILDRCNPETVAYTRCINSHKVGDVAGIFQPGIRPGKLPSDIADGTCGSQAGDLAGCFARRESRYSLVRKHCGNLNQAYEVCMMENARQSQNCLPQVKTLLQCTKNAIRKHLPSLERTQG